ncbi:putative ABC transport system ATP-binding protein [Rhodoplanes tepidamans]|uniref:ABC transporter ATP-binding protein n=1 Tax=Rhodoplanes TaxID=29407 RepID=UPI002780A875|nr:MULTISPECIES: ABC transporter ATP-binding protein [Rhodoplanes]MDQ0357894.1 putative ABC transport system ATP-binding protein [Rhodoplanes tepidamans]
MTAATTPIVEAVDVEKTLGEGAGRVQALRGVSLALKGGELTLLMGPSGSGKTTLLSILGGMLTPTRGTVRLAGETTTGAGPETLARLRRTHVGFVFQSYHLFPTLTAIENVRLVLDVRGEHGEDAPERAAAALATVGLAHKHHAFPRELSGGEQQRVAIARAVVGRTAALFADEPTASLDGDNGRAIMTVLADIAKDPRRAVLVVTHDPRTLPFADRIVRIEDGRIVAEEAGAHAGPAPREPAPNESASPKSVSPKSVSPESVSPESVSPESASPESQGSPHAP